MDKFTVCIDNVNLIFDIEESGQGDGEVIPSGTALYTGTVHILFKSVKKPSTPLNVYQQPLENWISYIYSIYSAVYSVVEKETFCEDILSKIHEKL